MLSDLCTSTNYLRYFVNTKPYQLNPKTKTPNLSPKTVICKGETLR